MLFDLQYGALTLSRDALELFAPDLMARSRDDDARARLSWPKSALLAPISDTDRRLVGE